MSRFSSRKEGLSIGDTVEVQWEDDGIWYPAVIISFNNNDDANVCYMDESQTSESAVATSRIRPREHAIMQTPAAVSSSKVRASSVKKQAKRRRAEDNDCHLVYIVGYPGAGKSTLSMKFIEKIEERQGGAKLLPVIEGKLPWLESKDKEVLFMGRWRDYHPRPPTAKGKLNGDDQNGQGADRIYPGPICPDPHSRSRSPSPAPSPPTATFTLTVTLNITLTVTHCQGQGQQLFANNYLHSRMLVRTWLYWIAYVLWFSQSRWWLLPSRLGCMCMCLSLTQPGKRHRTGKPTLNRVHYLYERASMNMALTLGR